MEKDVGAAIQKVFDPFLRRIQPLFVVIEPVPDAIRFMWFQQDFLDNCLPVLVIREKEFLAIPAG